MSITDDQPTHPSPDLDEIRRRYREEREKRLRADGPDQYIQVTGPFAHYTDDPWADADVTREPLHDEVEVLVVGGGFGGLLAGARMRQQGLDRIRFVDPASDFGGTWYWNRYPGISCDVESYVYLPLLEEVGYVPKRKYALTARRSLSTARRSPASSTSTGTPASRPGSRSSYGTTTPRAGSSRPTAAIR